MRTKKSNDKRREYFRKRAKRIRQSWTDEQRKANNARITAYRKLHPMTPAQLERHKLYMREYRRQLKLILKK
jgi:hypothetical protein